MHVHDDGPRLLLDRLDLVPDDPERAIVGMDTRPITCTTPTFSPAAVATTTRPDPGTPLG